MTALEIELTSFWMALIGYSVTTVISVYCLIFRRTLDRLVFTLMVLSWGLHTIAIGARWVRIDHLPFINIFEMLSANVWGLMAAIIIGYWLLPRLRAITALLLPLVMLITAWMLVVPNNTSTLPSTYHTIWLFIHIGFIKIFLGAAFFAVGIAVVILLRQANIAIDRLSRFPGNESLDDTAYRCMALALIFDTLGVVAGAIWAQDAWGHYWNWDPLEVWSLITWLAIGLTLHVRASFGTAPTTNALLILGTFVIAFFTFFGIPFVSKVLHQGAI
jgi:cytochrome c-type biogenesis protein CcsB